MKRLYTCEDRGYREAQEGQEAFWIELRSPDEREIKEITRAYELPRDYLTGVADPYEVPRNEGEDDPKPDLFILRYPIKNTDGSYDTRPVALILTKKAVITVHYDGSDFFRAFKEGKGPKLSKENTSPVEDMIINFAYYISKSYVAAIREINKEIMGLEQDIKRSTKSSYIEKNIILSRSLIQFKSATRENEPVLEAIFRLRRLDEDPDHDELLHDVQVESKQARLMAEDASQVMEKLGDLYSNVINNNLNEVMKTLTSITILMTVPTIVGGYWGMNTELPIQKAPFAFWWLILLSVVVILLLTWYLKKKDYL